MNRKYASYYIKNGEILIDLYGIEGFSTKEEAELYLDWVVNFNK